MHHFDDCFRFIESARSEDHGGVLVHCFMGYSRSSTIVLSYLMRKEGMNLKDATSDVMKVGELPFVFVVFLSIFCNILCPFICP